MEKGLSFENFNGLGALILKVPETSETLVRQLQKRSCIHQRSRVLSHAELQRISMSLLCAKAPTFLCVAFLLRSTEDDY